MLEVLRKVLDVLKPIIYGVALAYLLSPVLNFFEKKVFRFKSEKAGVRKLRRVLALLCTLLAVLILLTAVVSIFIPQAVSSYHMLADNVPEYIRSLDENLDDYLDNVFARNDFLQRIYANVRAFMGADEDHTLFSQVVEKVTNFLIGLISVENLSKLFSVGSSLLSMIINAVLTVIFSIYLLLSKENQLARIRKILTAFCKPETVKETYRVAYLADEKIGRYVRVQVFDSILVGIVSYFIYWICGMPFYPVLALISGVTNIIPYFGPFLGAIPNAVFILLAAPEKLIPFLLIVLIVQQLDGNVLVPILQSSNMKMDIFWVLTGMTIMGGFFGLPGMILGVPTFSVIYILVKERAEKKLKEKNLAVETEAYTGPYAERPPRQKTSLLSRIFRKKQEKQPPAPAQNGAGQSVPFSNGEPPEPETVTAGPSESGTGRLPGDETTGRKTPDDFRAPESRQETLSRTGGAGKKRKQKKKEK